MGKQKNLSQLKELYQANARDLSETDIGNMHDREIKVKIMMILTGLEGKKGEDLSETRNIVKRNNIAETQ